MFISIVITIIFIINICNFINTRYRYRKLKNLAGKLKMQNKISWKPKPRNKMIEELKEYKYDLLIIGGGSSGVGCALDAVTRGLNVAIIEFKDFGSETSSKSTKLLHGGIRYLDHTFTSFDFSQLKVVLSALNERWYVKKMAPYLTNTVQIMIPLYNRWKFLYYWILLKIYDMLSFRKSLGRSSFIDKKISSHHFGNLKKQNFYGSVTYYDGMFDDSRLNVMLAITASFYGATILNHMKFENFEKNDSGDLISATCTDQLSGEIVKIQAKGYISAVGPFTDLIRKKFNENINNIMVHSSGTHIILPPEYSPEYMGLVDNHTDDNRLLFILPWKGKTIVGSTEIKTSLTGEPVPKDEDVNFLINEVQKYVNKKVNKSDLLSVWTGFRPLVKDETKFNTEEIVRSHSILNMENQLIILTGGKWTTFRLMAEETIDMAIKTFKLNSERPCITKYLEILGCEKYSKDLYYDIKSELNCEISYAIHLLDYYGSRAFLLKQFIDEYPEKLSAKYEFREAEVIYCLEYEYGYTISDIINNRFRIGYFDVIEAANIVPKVCKLMKKYMRWDEKEEREQLEHVYRVLDSLGLSLIRSYSNK